MGKKYFGRAFACDKTLLKRGASCFIEVEEDEENDDDDDDSEEEDEDEEIEKSFWWGRIVSVSTTDDDRYLKVRAVIDGGRVQFDNWDRVIKTKTDLDNVSPKEYWVYPDTETVRYFIWKIFETFRDTLGAFVY